jgi:hypothetical protein
LSRRFRSCSVTHGNSLRLVVRFSLRIFGRRDYRGHGEFLFPITPYLCVHCGCY